MISMLPLRLGWTVCTLALAAVVSSSHSVGQKHKFSTRNPQLALQIRYGLGPLLSADAVIYDAVQNTTTCGATDFAEAIERWQEYDSPHFISAVQAAEENDVVATIKYANEHGIPFLARGGGHGAFKSLGALKDGIQISMPGLKSVVVNDDNTATVGGGARTIDIIAGLFTAGKQTVTGTCECTGVGAMLGGGHGYLQGLYGLAIDNILSARLVLGNGTVINTSADEHPDLWWALRGAGHNFGVITEVKYKTYDIPANDSWYHERWIYKGDAIESVFEQINALKYSGPPGLVSFVEFFRDSTYDRENAVLSMTLLFNGPQSEAERFVAPFRNFGHVRTVSGIVQYDKVAATTDAALESVKCQIPGINRVKNGIYVDEYNTTSQRKLYDYFNSVTKEIPAFSRSSAIFDAWPVHNPSKVPLDSTAMPYRDLGFLVAPVVVAYTPDPALDEAAEEFARNCRQILHEGTGLDHQRAYINYAFGDESLEELYGGKERVARLREVKRAYDPDNKFRFFGPITL